MSVLEASPPHVVANLSPGEALWLYTHLLLAFFPFT